MIPVCHLRASPSGGARVEAALPYRWAEPAGP